MDKIKEMSSLFAIDVCVFAVLANHYHIVMHVDEKRSLAGAIDGFVHRGGTAVIGAEEIGSNQRPPCDVDYPKCN